jgi:DNA gyrase subunit B/topoisomerase-4 subunit B
LESFGFLTDSAGFRRKPIVRSPRRLLRALPSAPGIGGGWECRHRRPLAGQGWPRRDSVSRGRSLPGRRRPGALFLFATVNGVPILSGEHMAGNKQHVYDESKIKTLSSLEHIRLRTGMYIGRIGNGSHPDDGCYILLKEVIDNAVDEFIMGAGREVHIRIDGTRVAVRDFGRGIPLGKVVDCVSKINTGAKYNDDVFQFSVGLNGVGTKAVNALSKVFAVRSHRDGEFVEASFKLGKLKHEKSGKNPKEPNGTYIEFEPDPEIFKETEFRTEHVERRLRHYSYLNTGLKLVLNIAGWPEPKTFQSRLGLMDLVMEDLTSDCSEPIYPPLHYASKTLEFCFTHSNSRYGEMFFSFVNVQYTSDGGTHLSAFREGLLKAVNEYANAKYEGDDVREAMVGAVAIRLKDPVFE